MFIELKGTHGVTDGKYIIITPLWPLLNLFAVHELNKVPLNINASRLDDVDGME